MMMSYATPKVVRVIGGVIVGVGVRNRPCVGELRYAKSG